MNSIGLSDQLRRDVDAVAQTLNKSSYLGESQLHTLNSKLDTLFNRIDILLHSQNLFNTDFLNEQRTRLISLWGRCHTLEIDSKVVNLAEEAQNLYRTESNQVENQIHHLKKALDEIKYTYALSIENKRIIHFTEVLMEQFQNQNLTETDLSEIALKSPETNEVLYILEIAKALYESQRSAAKTLLLSLSSSIQYALTAVLDEHQIRAHSLFEVSAKNFKRPDLAIKVFVGYCYFMTLENYRFELPSTREIEYLFSSIQESNF